MSTAHEQLVAQKFGPRATAYVASAVHAQGADLDRLVEIVRNHPQARVLDLGCGGGHVSFHVAPHVQEVVAYDLTTDMLAAVEKVAAERKLANIMTRQEAAEDLPFVTGSFDLVLSRYSAHHWHGFPRALAEAARVLKKGGIAVFMDVVAPGNALLDTYLQTVELLRDPSHVRDYSNEEWMQAIADAGFTPKALVERRLRLEFLSWVERIATPGTHTQAIRSLQEQMSVDVATHFEIEPDGTFTVDTITFELSH
jgi:SAM-dependent methyltransferase